MIAGLIRRGIEAGFLFLTETGLTVLKAGAVLIISAILIDYIGKSIRRGLSYRIEEDTIIDLIQTISKSALWFTALLVTLGILGFTEIAASLGTALGFVALGVSFALKNVISDTVAGIYLAKDPDFNKGDNIEVDGSKGEIKTVGLRKSRIKLENGDLRVINNSDAEKKWTKIS